MRSTSHFAPTPQRLPATSPLNAVSVISVTALAGISAFVRDTYGERVLRRANEATLIDIEAIEDQDCFIPHITMTTFLDTAAHHSGEENVGLTVAPYLTIVNYGCWGDYVIGAPTLGEAFERGRSTVGFHSRGDSVMIAVIDDEALISYNSAAKGQVGYAQVACGAAGVVLSVCQAFLPKRWRPHRIELDIPRPHRPDRFEDTFQCPVVFDAATTTVCIDKHALSAGPAHVKPRSLVTPEDLARSRVECLNFSNLRDVITEQIWSQVLAGHVSIESAARSIDTSVRTLQRELNREGTDFRTITNAMRCKRATELLRHTNASVTEISAMLGYSDSSHFARALRTATGMSPVEFRRARTARHRRS